MRLQYVKTSNHDKGMAAVKAVTGNGAKEARIILLTGEPGTGKSRFVDHWGSSVNAIHIEGMPGMTVGYLRELLAYELGITGGTRFAVQKGIQEGLGGRHLILDEAQHGLAHKAEIIEYLRRIAEQAGSALLLVCHTSERYRFAEKNLAHIGTRIAAVSEFTPASLDDCGKYLTDLCEVAVDEAIVKLAHAQSRGRYRLLASACITLELRAAQLGKSALSEADVKGYALCEDAMKALRKGA